MGRYLRGTNGFSYKYAFAAQDDNLRELPDAMGAGQVGLVPSFGGGYENVERNFDINAIPLLRAIQADGVARGGEIGGVVPAQGDALTSPTLEFVQYALGENIVEVVRRLDSALEDIPMAVMLEGYATLELDRADYPTALAYINQFLATAATLDDLRDEARVGALWEELGDRERYLPAMALSILRHAVTHDLSAISVTETDRSLYAPDFWDLATEWGPSIFHSAEPSSGSEWFARALVELFGGNANGARASIRAAVAGGFEPAARWAAHLGAGKPPKKKSKPKKSKAKKSKLAAKPKPKAKKAKPAAKKKPAKKKSKTKPAKRK